MLSGKRKWKLILVMGLLLTTGLILSVRGATPTLSVSVLILTALLLPAKLLKRRERLRWLPDTIASVLSAAYLGLSLKWGFIQGSERAVWATVFGCLSILAALSAISISRENPRPNGGETGGWPRSR